MLESLGRTVPQLWRACEEISGWIFPQGFTAAALACFSGIVEAVQKGQYLIDNHFAHSVKHQSGFENSDKLYRLLEDDDSDALNHGDASECLSKSGTVAAVVVNV